MSLLKKRWFKIVISLLLGGVFSEIISINIGDNSIQNSGNLALIGALFFYLIINLFIWIYYFFVYHKNSLKDSEIKEVIDEDY